LRDIVSELLTIDEPRRRFGAMMSGLDIHYDLSPQHPLIGRRMPDLDVVATDGPLRVFSLLHQGRAVLLNFGEPGRVEVSGWADRLHSVDAKYTGAWELPAIGVISGPAAVLVRPDGYVAWAGDGVDAGLTDALGTWLGPPT
jgi:3-(3-hydroxy-phenyl)propionate hydroxylase